MTSQIRFKFVVFPAIPGPSYTMRTTWQFRAESKDGMSFN
jgi:hypothetical protein